jgi:hypothetical protein
MAGLLVEMDCHPIAPFFRSTLAKTGQASVALVIAADVLIDRIAGRGRK